MFREEQHGRVGLDDGCLHRLVDVVFRCEIGLALPRAPVVCVDRFPSCRESRLHVQEMKDERAEYQADGTLYWLEAEETQKNDDEGQTEPFRAGEKNASRKKGRSPSNDSERRDRREQDAYWHRQRGSSPPAGGQQTPGQRKQSSGG